MATWIDRATCLLDGLSEKRATDTGSLCRLTNKQSTVVQDAIVNAALKDVQQRLWGLRKEVQHKVCTYVTKRPGKVPTSRVIRLLCR
eukprot:12895-Chlamydomonas_euryale.AAC.1